MSGEAANIHVRIRSALALVPFYNVSTCLSCCKRIKDVYVPHDQRGNPAVIVLPLTSTTNNTCNAITMSVI